MRLIAVFFLIIFGFCSLHLVAANANENTVNDSGTVSSNNLTTAKAVNNQANSLVNNKKKDIKLPLQPSCESISGDSTHKNFGPSFLNREIRVGVYPLAGFHDFDMNGECSGYDVDYLRRISGITGWSFKFVRAASWRGAVEMLRSGEIDLLSPAQITEERLRDFAFSVFPEGKVYAAILTLNDSPWIYEDYQAFGRMKFGIEKGNTYYDIFVEYARSHNFEPQITLYDNHTELVQALYHGEIDAMVANIMRTEPGMRLLGRAGTALFYFMSRREDVDLQHQLNRAMDLVDREEPDFQQKLIRSYFPIYFSDPMSRADLDYIKTLPVVRVIMPAHERPYSFIDRENGVHRGILVDYLRKSGERTGIRYTFIPVNTRDEAMAMVEAHKNDEIPLLITSNGVSSIEKSRSSYLFTDDILEGRELIVTKQHTPFLMTKTMRIGRTLSNSIEDNALHRYISNVDWTLFETTEECLDAVVSGVTDGCLMNEYATNWFLARPRYEGLNIANGIHVPIGYSLKVVAGGAPQFVSALNKSLRQVDIIEEEQLIIKYTTAMPYRMNAWEIIIKYKWIIGTVGVSIGIILCLLVAYGRNRNIRSQRDVLTGLYNRSAAQRIIDKATAVGTDASGVFLILDLDFFKEVNDTLGHQEGDKVLIETADILRHNCRSSDIICRLGGDEFVLYMPCEDASSFIEERLRTFISSLERDVYGEHECLHLSACIGVAICPADGNGFSELYKNADEALYAAKKSGRNCYKFHTPPVHKQSGNDDSVVDVDYG